MSQNVDFLFLGLGNGAVYAALAVAIVIVYRSSGVLNFATGAMALQAAQTYVFLRQGAFLVPLLPTTVEVGGPWGFWPALELTTVLSAALGLLLYFVVFRPLRRRSGLAKTVASLGVMIVLSALLGRRAVGGPALAGAIFPGGRIEFAGSFITRDRLRQLDRPPAVPVAPREGDVPAPLGWRPGGAPRRSPVAGGSPRG